MFTNISWGNYITGFALLTASWYLFVGLRFYFKEIKEIAAGKRKIGLPKRKSENYQVFPSALNDQYFPKSTLPATPFKEFDTTFEEVDILIEGLKNVIADSSHRKLGKPEFIINLKIILKDYPSVKTSAFSSSVSEFIVAECDKLKYTDLNQKEAEALWT